MLGKGHLRVSRCDVFVAACAVAVRFQRLAIGLRICVCASKNGTIQTFPYLFFSLLFLFFFLLFFFLLFFFVLSVLLNALVCFGNQKLTKNFFKCRYAT